MSLARLVEREYHGEMWEQSAKAISGLTDEEKSLLLQKKEAGDGDEINEARIALFRIYFIAYQLQKNTYWSFAIQKSLYWKVFGKYDPITNLLVKIDLILEKMAKTYFEIGDKIIIGDQKSRSQIRNLANKKTIIKNAHLLQNL